MQQPINTTAGFGLNNLPLGIFSTPGTVRRPGVALGGDIIDLEVLERLGRLPQDIDGLGEALQSMVLNELLALGRRARVQLRERLQLLFGEGPSALQGVARAEVLVPLAHATLHMPLRVPNYTDFYSSEYHATNVGRMFRPDSPLMPNWKHMPIAYHGRASSIAVSGMHVLRPQGQIKLADQEEPIFGPTRQLDYELETAFVVGRGSMLGRPVPVAQAEEYMAGMVLFNDWSARDIQAWEYQPLGPFGGKNFCSVISPWLVTMEALAPFRVQSPAQEPAVLPYLQHPAQSHYDIELTVSIRPGGMGEETLVGRTNHRHLYWSQAQQLAHHTVTGCNMQVGDLCGSGTISGPTPDSLGCLLEATQRGKHPFTLADGSQRTFLEDGDEVIVRGHAGAGSAFISLGECRSQVVGVVIRS